MLCSSCRRQLTRGAEHCGCCGAPRPGVDAPLELVLPDTTRIPVVGEIVIGRAPGSTLQLDDPSVSRTHARIVEGNGGSSTIEDVGSSHGTFLDGHQVGGSAVPLHDGARIQIGNAVLNVERRRDDAEAGRTIVVRPGASLLVNAIGTGEVKSGATQFGFKPRVRSGYALKRLEANEGNKRFVLRDLNTGKFLRLSENDAEVFEKLDGTNGLVDLIGFAEQRFGTGGSARVARLLSDLGERGFLAGVASSQAEQEAPQGFWRKLFMQREKAVTGVGKVFDKMYEKGAWILFTKPVLIFIGVLVVAGLGAFGYLIGARYGTPFVVAEKIGLGALVFLVGRFCVVAVHETAHGLTMASFGRKIDKAGLKFMFVLPYAFVDTSEAWFEPRRRRIAISAAGPVSDFSLGAIFSICSLLLEGTVREVFFQLAFAAYIGAFFNLNPFLDRDGYHIMVDVLQEPGLRKRAKDQFERKLSGKGKSAGDNPVLARYSVAGLGWGVLMAGFAIFMSLRYEPIMTAIAGKTVVWIVLGTLWFIVFIPVLVVIVKPLVARLRGPKPAT